MNQLAIFVIVTLTSCLVEANAANASNESSVRGAGKSQTRDLVDGGVQVTGECTLSNFIDSVGGEDALAGYLGVPVEDLKDTMDTRCFLALEPTIDLSVAVGKGPQFLKNFLDGGTTWNDNYKNTEGEYSLEVDSARIGGVYSTDGKHAVFSTPDGGTSETYPQYFSNFYNGDRECRLGAMTCCYTASRGTNGLPSSDSAGSAKMCAHDMTLSAKSNHIKSKSYTIFDTQPADDTYCTGFAWEEGSFSDAVKYNTLFHLTVKNLFDPTKGYVKNIPGAPMCGCTEQMPIIDNAACTKVKEGYTIDTNTGEIKVDLSWEDCGNLRDHYSSLPGRGDTEKFFMNSQIVEKGKCEKAAKSFMNDRMMIH